MKQHFFLKLVPCRPRFAQDMTAAERATMGEHVAYWRGLMETGEMIVFGPVLDPAGAFGVGIVEVESRERIEELTAADPAAQINRYEITPMQAVFLPRQSDALVAD